MGSRLNTFWGGVLLGAILGAITGLMIWLILACTLAVIFANVPELRHGLFAEMQGKSALAIIGELFATLGLLILYGALPGAVIMAVASMLRANRDRAPNSN